MLGRPHRMRLGIVADVDAAGAQQCERFVQKSVLAGPAIGKDEIEGVRGSRRIVRAASSERIVNLGSVSQMRSGDGLNRRININRG